MPRGSPGTPTVTPIGRAAGGAPPSVLGGPITIGVMSAIHDFGSGKRSEARQSLDRLLDKPAAGDRWVRLGALEVAGRPGGAAFLSTPTLRRAAEDSDGFVREAAQRLLQQRK